MCVYVYLCVWEKLDLLFEQCVACQLVRAASCILLHILAVWIGVVRPPVVLVIAQACGSGESWEGAVRQKKTQCHLYATSLTHNPSRAICLTHSTRQLAWPMGEVSGTCCPPSCAVCVGCVYTCYCVCPCIRKAEWITVLTSVLPVQWCVSLTKGLWGKKDPDCVLTWSFYLWKEKQL